MLENARLNGYTHLGAAMGQSAGVAVAIGVVVTYGKDLPGWVLVFGSLLLGVPALYAIQRSWIRFLWARKLVAARRFAVRHRDSLDAQYELGILEATRGRNEAARDAFDAALSLSPKHAPSLVGHGHIAAQLGDLSGALRYFEQAAQLDEGLFSAFFGMGTILQAREQYARSISAFEQALGLEPGDGPTLAEIARCHLALGDPERALGFQQRALAAGFRDHDLERAIRDQSGE